MEWRIVLDQRRRLLPGAEERLLHVGCRRAEDDDYPVSRPGRCATVALQRCGCEREQLQEDPCAADGGSPSQQVRKASPSLMLRSGFTASAQGATCQIPPRWKHSVVETVGTRTFSIFPDGKLWTVLSVRGFVVPGSVRTIVVSPKGAPPRKKHQANKIRICYPHGREFTSNLHIHVSFRGKSVK